MQSTCEKCIWNTFASAQCSEGPVTLTSYYQTVQDTEIHFTQYDKKNTSGKERPKLLFPIKAITETAARTTFPVLVENETTPRLWSQFRP